MEMKKWWQILIRRRVEAISIALIILVAGISAALLLPSSYRSTATILVNDQEMPKGVSDASISGYADRRINLLTKQVLSSDHLNRLAKEFNLYEQKEFKDGKLSLTALDDLRKRIDINLNKAKVIDSKMRFLVDAVISFDVSFIDKNPEVAQKVTEYIVNLFLKENKGAQPKTTTAALELLKKQELELSEKVKAAENRLKVFKSNALYSLPEMKDSNIRNLEKTNDEILNIRSQLRALQEKRIFLESELMRLSPTAIAYDSEGNRVLGNEDRLKVLRAEYEAKRSRYSPDHPDLKRLRREIAGLQSSVGLTSAGKDLAANLLQLKSELASLKERYTDTHPSITSLKKRIASLSSALRGERRRSISPAARGDADNPAYISTVSKLKSTELDITMQQDILANLLVEKSRIEKRLEMSPAVEREYLQLEREYKEALTEYDAIREKHFNAQLAGSLESSKNTEGLKLLEPANFPEKPYKPNRKLLLLLSIVLASWAAVGVALVREHFDDRIWSSDDIASELMDPPLSTIPDFSHRRNRRSPAKVLDLTLTPSQQG
ncbi:MAG TPA: hypothetical protein EYH03_06280 [Chromatiales bacterium]|nr:hypothetical protein [Chromatiales bacterium]